MEEVRSPFEEALSELIRQEQEKRKQFQSYADDIRIEYGVPEDVLYLGYLDTFHREFMVSPQMKELFLSIGIHVCIDEDEGEEKSTLFYLFMEKKV